MSMFRYYAAKPKGQALVPAKATHTNFLRTGRISRQEEPLVVICGGQAAARWTPDGRRPAKTLSDITGSGGS